MYVLFQFSLSFTARSQFDCISLLLYLLLLLLLLFLVYVYCLSSNWLLLLMLLLQLLLILSRFVQDPLFFTSIFVYPTDQ